MTATHLTAPTRFIEVDGEAAIRRSIPGCLKSRRLLFRPLRTSSFCSLVARTPRNRPAITQPTLVLNGVNRSVPEARHPVPGGVMRSRISVTVKRGQHR